MDHAALYFGGVATENARVAESLDIIRTEAGTRLRFEMRDGTMVTLGDNAIFVIDKYSYDNDDTDKGRFRLVQGAFQFVSGKIAEHKASNLQVTTPVATIGIRGTGFWGGPSRDGFGFLLLEGHGIYVENNSGRVEIDAPGQGTIVHPGKAPRTTSELMSLGPAMRPIGERPVDPFAWPQDLRSQALSSIAFAE